MGKMKVTDNIVLSGYNDIFSVTAEPAVASPPTADTQGERIVEIPLTKLHPPEFHPFHVNDDDSMIRLSKNIKQYGVRNPGLARPRPDGDYELLCGNRRHRASELAELPNMPVIIRKLDDHSAAIAMVDSNLEHREKLLFSEKAWAYQIKLEALNHQGKKSDNPGELSINILCNQTGESKNQIYRLVRLTKLIVTLLDKVDSNQLAFNPAVELSYLSQKEQSAIASAMDKYEIKPTLSQAVRLKKLKQAEELTLEMIDSILSESNNPHTKEPTGTMRYREYFPSDYSQTQIDEIITALLKDWQLAQSSTVNKTDEAA